MKTYYLLEEGQVRFNRSIPMRLIIEDNYQEMSKKAALLVASQVRLQPDSVLGLATGSTPLGMYQELIKMHERDELDFSEVKTFNLDEYYKLPPTDPCSYHYYMKHNFFKKINIKPENTYLLNGQTENVEMECNRYEQKLQQTGGINLQVLGIGPNGHIGFNEPGQKLNITTHLVKLSQETITANSRFFDVREDVPRQAITMGIANILKADRILLLASGENKAQAIKDTISGFVSTEVPSSLIQTHPRVTIIIDKEAAKLLS